MRKLTLHLIVFLALWWLYNALRDTQHEQHARRADALFDAEGRDDWAEFGAAMDYLAGGES